MNNIREFTDVLSNVSLGPLCKTLRTTFVEGDITRKLTSSSLIWYQIRVCPSHGFFLIVQNKFGVIRLLSCFEGLKWTDWLHGVSIGSIQIIQSVSAVKWRVLNPTGDAYSVPNIGLWFIQECTRGQVFDGQRFVFIICSAAKQLLQKKLESN